MRQNRLVWLLPVILLLQSIALVAQEAVTTPPSDSFTFVVLGDSRGSKDGVSEVFIKMVPEIARLNPAFVVHTGDAVSGSRDRKKLVDQLTAYKKVVESLKMPVYVAPGNHEIQNSVENDAVFRQMIGPAYQSFDYGNSHFTILSSEIPGEQHRVMGNQMSWLKKDLKKGMKAKHRFVFIHAPLFPVSSHVGSSLDRFSFQRNELFDLLKRHHVEYVFVGHEHLYHRSEHDGLTQIITGGAGAPLTSFKSSGGFYHYLVVTVKGDDIKVDVRKIEK